ncbi:isocitrate lyase/phosphoenolpyruvate mutase family protein [Alphaproteobacteria bacterium]|nr:isocitrate lyase/phosphoenolpyruvate mutase family protein [Alphaproteobacteria bacterium]
MTSNIKNLNTILEQEEILVVPGGGTAFELKLAELAGFNAGYVSGYATSAAIYAVPDVGLIAYNEMELNVKAIKTVTSIPLIVDCDTGYGDIANVFRTVRGMEIAGASAIQLEDQKWPKKCGHMEGKIIEPVQVAIERIKAAVQARESTDFKIIARTDARAPLGFDEALKRLELYKKAGADILFMDAIENEKEMEQQISKLDGYQMVNMSETGKTPLMSSKELEEIGYKIVIFPSSMIRIMTKQLTSFLKELKQSGDSKGWLNRMASLDETNSALGLEELNEISKIIRD